MMMTLMLIQAPFLPRYNVPSSPSSSNLANSAACSESTVQESDILNVCA